jgi:hypothetical protein
MKIRIKNIRFSDYPEFLPNITPREIFRSGSFGGTYWRPIFSRVTGKKYQNQHKHNKIKKYWKNIAETYLSNGKYKKDINYYKVKCGSSLEDWEDSGWISKYDPYGWVQWYCHFFSGRRKPEEDKRQIKRWLKFTGPKGRFKKNLLRKIIKADTVYDDLRISPVIRQSLLHWAYQITEKDLKEEKKIFSPIK